MTKGLHKGQTLLLQSLKSAQLFMIDRSVTFGKISILVSIHEKKLMVNYVATWQYKSEVKMEFDDFGTTELA